MVCVGLVVDILEDGPHRGVIHAKVPLIGIPESNEDAGNSFCAFLVGEKACRKHNIRVAVIMGGGIERNPCNGT